jgi:hypothetical protein
MKYSPDLPKQLHRAYEIILCRPPHEAELKILEQQYAFQLARFQQNTAAAKQLLAVGETSASEQFDSVHLASLTMLCNTLLNLDETVTRN